jgi:hypothetical protein
MYVTCMRVGVTLTTVGNHSVLPSYPGSWCNCLDAMRLLSARGAVQVLEYAIPWVWDYALLLSGHFYVRVHCAAVEKLNRRSTQLSSKALLLGDVQFTVYSNRCLLRLTACRSEHVRVLLGSYVSTRRRSFLNVCSASKQSNACETSSASKRLEKSFETTIARYTALAFPIYAQRQGWYSSTTCRCRYMYRLGALPEWWSFETHLFLACTFSSF